MSFERRTLGDDGNTPLGGPAEEDLCGSLGVLLRDLRDNRAVEKGLRSQSSGVVELEEGLRPETRISHDANLEEVAEGDHGRLGEVAEKRGTSSLTSRAALGEKKVNPRVVLNLEDGRRDFGGTDEVEHCFRRGGLLANPTERQGEEVVLTERAVEVADTDLLRQTSLVRRLDRSPSLRNGDLGRGDLSSGCAIPPAKLSGPKSASHPGHRADHGAPFGRVASSRVNN